jgi:hypothetical protein
MIGEKFDRIGSANVMRVAAPRIGRRFLQGVLSDRNLAIPYRSESLGPVVKQMIEARQTKRFGSADRRPC